MTLPGCPEVTTLFSTRAQRLPSEPNTRCYISGIHKLGTLHLVMFESIGHGVTIGSILQQIKQTVEEGGTFKSIFFTEISGSQINCFSFKTAANSIMVGNPQQLQSSRVLQGSIVLLETAGHRPDFRCSVAHFQRCHLFTKVSHLQCLSHAGLFVCHSNISGKKSLNPTIPSSHILSAHSQSAPVRRAWSILKWKMNCIG